MSGHIIHDTKQQPVGHKANAQHKHTKSQSAGHKENAQHNGLQNE